jgi:hypothetical protein
MACDPVTVREVSPAVQTSMPARTQQIDDGDRLDFLETVRERDQYFRHRRSFLRPRGIVNRRLQERLGELRTEPRSLRYCRAVLTMGSPAA